MGVTRRSSSNEGQHDFEDYFSGCFYRRWFLPSRKNNLQEPPSHRIYWSRPDLPLNPSVLRFFEITIATRFKHWEDCIHFWTCLEFKKDSKKLPLKHSCPYTRVFDPKTEKCVFYKYADPPCNKAFDHLDSRILALYEKSYNDEVI